MNPSPSSSSWRLAGVAALASPVLVLIGLGVPFRDDVSEMLLVVAPALLAPTMFVLRGVRRFRWLGMSGVYAVVVLLALQGLHELGVGVPDGLSTFFAALTGGMSAWMILTGLRGPATSAMPIGVATLGVTAGTSWLAMLPGSLPQGGLLPAPFWSTLAPVWALSYLVYTVWLGCWMVLRGSARVRLQRG